MLGAAVLSSSTLVRDSHAFVAPAPNARIVWLVGRLASLAALLDASERAAIRGSVQPGDVLTFYTCADTAAPRRPRVRVEIADAATAARQQRPAAPWRCAGVVRITDDGEELLA